MSGERVAALEVAPEDAFAAWQQLRDRADELSGQPIALMDWDGKVSGESLFSRWFYGEEDASAPGEVIEGARAISPEQGLAHWLGEAPDDWVADNWDSVVEEALESTREAYGDAPSPDEVLALDLGREEHRLERWLMDWENERGAPQTPPYERYLEEFEPPADDPVVVAVLPVGAPEETLAYASFYGAEGKGGHERLIPVLRAWRERFGAVLWANWGTMLQFEVERPPEDLDTCFALAREQAVIAPDTLRLPGVTLRDHARVLRGRRSWFLHNRP
jgi:hypothetical protein